MDMNVVFREEEKFAKTQKLDFGFFSDFTKQKEEPEEDDGYSAFTGGGYKCGQLMNDNEDEEEDGIPGAKKTTNLKSNEEPPMYKAPRRGRGDRSGSFSDDGGEED